MRRLYTVVIIVLAICILRPAQEILGFDCEQASSEAKRFYSMAQGQLEGNPKAAEDFLLQALGKITDCEYIDDLKQEFYTALGELYYKQKTLNKAIEYLEKAIESGMNIESPNSYPAVLLGDICNENSKKDITFFPKALHSYKKALEINNFASSALGKDTEEKLKLLQKQTSRIETQLWKMARTKEAKGKWKIALDCYNSLALLGRYDKLAHYKSRAQFNVYLYQADRAISDLNLPKADQALKKAKATRYYAGGNGKDEFDKKSHRLKKTLGKPF